MATIRHSHITDNSNFSKNSNNSHLKYAQKKVLFIGDESTNHRQVLISFVKDRYTEGYFSSNYFNFKFKGYEILIEEQEVELNLWELDVSEKNTREKSLAYVDSDVVVLCFERWNLDSLKRITKKFHDEVKGVVNCPVLLVGIKSQKVVNKSPVLNEGSVLDIDVKIAMKSCGARDFVECEYGSKENVKSFMNGVIHLAKFPDEKHGKCVVQ